MSPPPDPTTRKLSAGLIIEAALALQIVVLGCWAIYYWILAVALQCTLTDLVAYSPALVLIILGVYYLYIRKSPQANQPGGEHAARETIPPWPPSLLWALLAGLALAILLLLGSGYELPSPALSAAWFAGLVAALYLYHLVAKNPTTGSDPQTACSPSLQHVDTALFLAGAMALCIGCYGINFPTPDDAYYTGIIGYTLANPNEPLTNTDFLLGTDAPFSLHPSYSVVGHEPLIALISNAFGSDSFSLYYVYIPIWIALIWCLAAYTFFKVIGLPVPGTAVCIASALYLLWAPAAEATNHSANLAMGKHALALLAAPVLFPMTLRAIEYDSFIHWLLLGLAVSALTSMSSSAFFLVPVTVSLALLVFADASRRSLLCVAKAFICLLPTFAGIAYTHILLRQYPVHTTDNTGRIYTLAEAWGGNPTILLLGTGCLLYAVLARTLPSPQARYRSALIAGAVILISLSPVIADAIARLTGMHLISDRLLWAAPRIEIVAAVLSLLLYRGYVIVFTRAGLNRVPYLAIGTSTIWVIAFLSWGNFRQVYDDQRKFSAAIFRSIHDEAADIRRLIPDDAYVLSGQEDWAIAAVAAPPTFAALRHYLPYHKNFIPEAEYSRRRIAAQILRTAEKIDADSRGKKILQLEKLVTSLGIDTVVFSNLYGKNNPAQYELRVAFNSGAAARFADAGWACTLTPSELSRVCNKAQDSGTPAS